jgi:hypothetical protein
VDINQNGEKPIFQLAVSICAPPYFYHSVYPPQIPSGRETPTGLPAKYGLASLPPSIKLSIKIDYNVFHEMLFASIAI